MVGRCTLPPKKEVRVDFSIFPQGFWRDQAFGILLGVASTEPLGPSNLMNFPPWKSPSVEPRTLVHLENDIILILLAWEVWKLLRDCEMVGDSDRELKNYNQD